MRDLAAEPPPVAAEVQAGLLRQEPALVAKNSCVLIVKIYENLLLNVYLFVRQWVAGHHGYAKGGVLDSSSRRFPDELDFLGAHFQTCRSIRARRRP